MNDFKDVANTALNKADWRTPNILFQAQHQSTADALMARLSLLDSSVVDGVELEIDGEFDSAANHIITGYNVAHKALTHFEKDWVSPVTDRDIKEIRGAMRHSMLALADDRVKEAIPEDVMNELISIMSDFDKEIDALALRIGEVEASIGDEVLPPAGPRGPSSNSVA